MTSPDRFIPPRASVNGTVSQLQGVTQEGIAQETNQQFAELLGELRDTFIHNLLGGFTDVAAHVLAAINKFISDLVYALKGITGGWIDLTGLLRNTQTQATEAQANTVTHGVIIRGMEQSKADVLDVPNNIPMGASLNPLEDPTFYRMFLNRNPKWVAGATEQASHSALGTHAHAISVSTSPFYRPAKDVMEIGFIRVPRNRKYNTVGLIVGAQTSPCPMYLAVYRLRDDRGLELLWASSNIAGLITAAKSEVRFDIETDLIAQGGDYFGVGILQTGAGNVRDLAGMEMEPIAVPNLTFPPKINGLYGSVSSPPNVIDGNAISFAQDWVPWACIGQSVMTGPKPALNYRDTFDRPNSGNLGRDWAARGGIGVDGGTAWIPDGADGFRSALWVYPLNYDNHECSIVVTPAANSWPSFAVARANNMFTSGVGVYWKNEGSTPVVGLAICTGVNNYTIISSTQVACQLNSGDVLTIKAVGHVYTILRNGEVITVWNDTAGNVPIGPEYRFVGLGLFRQLFGNSARILEWGARDLVEEG